MRECLTDEQPLLRVPPSLASAIPESAIASMTSRDGGDAGASEAELEVEEEDPAALDFLSPSFDPLRALHAPGLQPPDPAAQPLDNVAKCRAVLPPEHPDALCNLVKKQASEVGAAHESPT